MNKQWTMIFASFVLLSALTTATVAQGRPPSGGAVSSGCRLNEDGTSKCGQELPPIRPAATPTGAAPATSASTASTIWWSVVWNWLTGF